MHIVAPPCRSAAKLLHRVATEAESTLRRRNILLEGELACSAIHFRSDVVVIVLIIGEWRGDVGVNDRLDLRGIAGSDVGDSPAGLLADTVLGAREKAEEGGKGTTVDDDLGLNIVTSDDVADRAESRRLDRGGRVHQQFNEATAHARLNDSLNLLVGAIG
ncbi:hypothetical protein BC936DRAFT_144843 [Jimgerdemannia flammicorona]|uniref:Uncharacterized protein n=1 Tax=Jimgerdemannia flammicorona TaxID=994334 RepID=A0A433DBI1_9FUNG|nr:hypothetical protein BC936DRAFT_144843 [Jimgerdemannia flammicorona]